MEEFPQAQNYNNDVKSYNNNFEFQKGTQNDSFVDLSDKFFSLEKRNSLEHEDSTDLVERLKTQTYLN